MLLNVFFNRLAEIRAPKLQREPVRLVAARAETMRPLIVAVRNKIRQRCFTDRTERLQVAVPVNPKHRKQPVTLLFRRAALLGFLLFLLIAPLVTKAATVAQVQEEAIAENQTATETDADAEKKAEHWRREIGGEEFINIHVAYSFCFWFALGVVFGFSVWCVPNIIVLHLDFKNRNRWGR